MPRGVARDHGQARPNEESNGNSRRFHHQMMENMMVHKWTITRLMMVYFMENPIEKDGFWGTPILENPQMVLKDGSAYAEVLGTKFCCHTP